MKIDIGFYYGPIDLLVYLVRKKELNIFDIPIAQVSEEYLDYLRRIERDDLEDAADFLLMAAILIRLKVRSLLPRTPADEEEVKPVTLMDIIDEFQKYKEIARYFGEREGETRKQFPRFSQPQASVVLEDGDVNALYLAFRQLMPAEEKRLFVKRQEVPIETIITDLKERLENQQRIDFLTFLKERNNMPLAVGYFFGMLELVKEGFCTVEQADNFGAIQVARRKPAPLEIAPAQ